MKNIVFVIIFFMGVSCGALLSTHVIKPKDESIKMMISRYEELHQRYDALKDEAITCEYENAVLVRKFEMLQKKIHQACDCNKDMSVDIEK